SPCSRWCSCVRTRSAPPNPDSGLPGGALGALGDGMARWLRHLRTHPLLLAAALLGLPAGAIAVHLGGSTLGEYLGALGLLRAHVLGTAVRRWREGPVHVD